VISSQAPYHRLHRPAPREPLHGLLVGVDGDSSLLPPGECPEGRAGLHVVPTRKQPLSGAGERMQEKTSGENVQFVKGQIGESLIIPKGMKN